MPRRSAKAFCVSPSLSLSALSALPAAARASCSRSVSGTPCIYRRSLMASMMSLSTPCSARTPNDRGAASVAAGESGGGEFGFRFGLAVFEQAAPRVEERRRAPARRAQVR